MKVSFRNLGLGIVVLAMSGVLPQAWQQPRAQPPSSERAQDQPFPPGSPFALLPGFRIERVTPETKNESYIVVTFDPQGRPVVSQSSSGNGSSPRVLLDEDKDGRFEADQLLVKCPSKYQAEGAKPVAAGGV